MNLIWFPVGRVSPRIAAARSARRQRCRALHSKTALRSTRHGCARCLSMSRSRSPCVVRMRPLPPMRAQRVRRAARSVSPCGCAVVAQPVAHQRRCRRLKRGDSGWRRSFRSMATVSRLSKSRSTVSRPHLESLPSSWLRPKRGPPGLQFVSRWAGRWSTMLAALSAVYTADLAPYIDLLVVSDAAADCGPTVTGACRFQRGAGGCRSARAARKPAARGHG